MYSLNAAVSMYSLSAAVSTVAQLSYGRAWHAIPWTVPGHLHIGTGGQARDRDDGQDQAEHACISWQRHSTHWLDLPACYVPCSPAPAPTEGRVSSI
jgi:hypothetical protein